MSNETTEQLKKFVFTSKTENGGISAEETLEIIIPEVFLFDFTTIVKQLVYR